MNEHSRKIVFCLWLCFFCRGWFYCSFMPLWEGYDEWSHFGHIERLITKGELLSNREESISQEVLFSLQNAPVAWELRSLPLPFLPHDDYWKLSEDERSQRVIALKKIDPALGEITAATDLKIYEALQPPLYYWLLAVPYQLLQNAPLMERVFLLRYISMGIASLIVPLIFLTVFRVTNSHKTAMMTTALFVALPEMMINVSRIGNECLGILIFSALILVSLSLETNRTSHRKSILLGILLGLGLLTKAYFLTAVPVIFLMCIWKAWRTGEYRQWIHSMCLTYGAAVLISGWWYIRNKVMFGTWSGLSESVLLKHLSFAEWFSGIQSVDWRNAVDSILVSHIWFGAWSSLVVRSWIYHVLFILIGLSVLGVILFFIRENQRREPLFILLLIYGFYWLGQLFNVLLLFLSKGESTSMGWYMYCVIAAQLSLLAVGMQAIIPGYRKPVLLLLLLFLMVVLDLYTVYFVSIPYYTGLTAHRSNGFLENFHLYQISQTGMQEILSRLSTHKAFWLSPFSLSISSFLHLSGTLGLFIFAVRIFTIPEAARKN